MEFIKKYKFIIIAIALIVALTIVFTVNSSLKDKKMKKATEAGRKFLAEQQAGNMEETEKKIKEVYSQRKKKQMDEYVEKIKNGEVDVWGLFGDTIIMGDSRAVGFDVFGCLPPEHVIAGAGYTIRNIKDSYKTLEKNPPANLILCYGLNDMGIGFWKSSESYTEEYLSIIKELKKRLPNTNIYINLTIPANGAGLEKDPAAKPIPEYNQALMKMCGENNIRFVDCTGLVAQNPDFYDLDGLHLRKEFYPYWGMQMVFTMNEYDSQE